MEFDRSVRMRVRLREGGDPTNSESGIATAQVLAAGTGRLISHPYQGNSSLLLLFVNGNDSGCFPFLCFFSFPSLPTKTTSKRGLEEENDASAQKVLAMRDDDCTALS